MRKLVCDICGKELDEIVCYDDNGYSKYVNVEIRNSRKHGAEYDLCNNCYEDILKYVKEKGEKDDYTKKNCKNCDYYVNKYGYGQCYGQKNAPRVEDNECCESWEKKKLTTEMPQTNHEIRWTDKLSLDNDGNIRDFYGNIIGHLKGDTE